MDHTIRFENFKKTFIHEVGHFVSDLIIYELIQDGKPHKIILREVYPNKFIGECNTLRRQKSTPKKYFPNNGVLYDFESSITLLMGCFFQSIYSNNEYKNCFYSIDGSNDWVVFDTGRSFLKRAKEATRELIDKHYVLLLESELSHKLQSFNFSKFYSLDSILEFTYDELNAENEIINIKAILKPLFLAFHEEIKTTPCE